MSDSEGELKKRNKGIMIGLLNLLKASIKEKHQDIEDLQEEAKDIRGMLKNIYNHEEE